MDTDLNVKCKIIKLLEHNIEENIYELRYGNDFLNTTPRASSMKEVTHKMDFIKNKNFCFTKDTANRIRRQAIDWGKVFAKDTSNKGLLFEIYKQLLKLNNKET